MIKTTLQHHMNKCGIDQEYQVTCLGCKNVFPLDEKESAETESCPSTYLCHTFVNQNTKTTLCIWCATEPIGARLAFAGHICTCERILHSKGTHFYKRNQPHFQLYSDMNTFHMWEIVQNARTSRHSLHGPCDICNEAHRTVIDLSEHQMLPLQC